MDMYLVDVLFSAARVVFFFQAEDGIRDYKVTGVQTCDLPISECGCSIRRICSFIPTRTATTGPTAIRLCTSKDSALKIRTRRSEERRVGKECRSGEWTDHEKKKDKMCEETCTHRDVQHR